MHTCMMLKNGKPYLLLKSDLPREKALEAAKATAEKTQEFARRTNPNVTFTIKE